MTYDRSAIMLQAWAIAREEIRRSPVVLGARSRRFVFRHALRNAWATARMALHAARKSPAVRAIEAEIFALEGKNRWTAADYRLRQQLTTEWRAAHLQAA